MERPCFTKGVCAGFAGSAAPQPVVLARCSLVRLPWYLHDVTGVIVTVTMCPCRARHPYRASSTEHWYLERRMHATQLENYAVCVKALLRIAG